MSPRTTGGDSVEEVESGPQAGRSEMGAVPRVDIEQDSVAAGRGADPQVALGRLEYGLDGGLDVGDPGPVPLAIHAHVREHLPHQIDHRVAFGRGHGDRRSSGLEEELGTAARLPPLDAVLGIAGPGWTTLCLANRCN